MSSIRASSIRLRKGVAPEAEEKLSSTNAATVTLDKTHRYACDKCGRSYSRLHTIRRHNKDHPHCEDYLPRADRATQAKTTPNKSASKVLPCSAIQLPVFNPNRKRPIDQIPAGALIRPNQVVSKQKYDHAKR